MDNYSIEHLMMRFWVSTRDDGAPKRPRNPLQRIAGKTISSDDIAPLGERDYLMVLRALERLKIKDVSAYYAVWLRYACGLMTVKQASKQIRCSEATYKIHLRVGMAFLSALLIDKYRLTG